MAGPALDEELISLHYYARQQCSRQWVHFMAAMFAEFEERVDPAEADQFLEAIGLKMARLLPLRKCASLEELEDDINSVLEGIDWGWMRIREHEGFYRDHPRRLPAGATGREPPQLAGADPRRAVRRLAGRAGRRRVLHRASRGSVERERDLADVPLRPPRIRARF